MGEIFYAPYDVVLSDFDVVEPDLIYVAAEQSDVITDKHIRGTPTLVIEIVSPGARKTDEQTKRRLFERAGTREYWVVDPELDVVKIYRRSDQGDFPRVAELSREAANDLTTPLLPGFSLPLDGLFH